MHIHTYTLRSIKKAFPESQTKKYREAKNPTSFDTHPIIQLISVYTTCIRDFRRLCWPLRRRVVQRIARAHACTRIKGVCINKQAGEPSSRDLWREISFFFFFYFLFISLLDRRKRVSRSRAMLWRGRNLACDSRVCVLLSFLLSQRKLCNSENFRIEDFDWLLSQNNRFEKNVCMYICMKPNFVPSITLERMDIMSWTVACILGMS